LVFNLSAIGKDSLAVRKKFLMLGFNSVAYKGSLQSSYKRWTPAFQVGIKFEKRKKVNGMISIGFGEIIGEDRTYQKPTNAQDDVNPVSRFRTSFFTLGYEAQILLFKYKSLKVFAGLGLGLFRFTPKDQAGESLVLKDKTRERGEEYSTNSLFLPTHLGLQYMFPNQMGLGFQVGYLNVSSRYLDNMDKLSSNDSGDNVAAFRFQFFYYLKDSRNNQ
jgi:hypothetical protein